MTDSTLARLLMVLLLLPALARTDAIVRSEAMFATTIAEFFVTGEGVRVALEIGVDDVSAFRNLLPDEIAQGLGFSDRPLQERLQAFFESDMPILADGERLPGFVTAIGPSERVPRDAITGEPLPATDGEGATVILAELFFPFGESLPGQLVLAAPNRFDPANIGFVLYHDTVAVNDFRYLVPGLSVRLDWEDPWYTAFGSRSMQRSYSAPMSGFLYVEHFEVRKEIIVRPKDLQRWVDLGLEGAEVVAADQRGQVLETIATFLADRQVVTIDGEAATPVLDRANFLNRTLKQSMVVEPGINIDIESAIVGVIFVYPINGLPQQATMTWDLFDERIQRIPVASVDEAGPLPTFLDPEYPALEWQNFLKNPSDPGLVALAAPPSPIATLLYGLRWWALGGAILLLMLWGRRQTTSIGIPAAALLVVVAAAFVLGRPLAPANAATEQVVVDLLRNIYKAFDYRDREAIYDTLSRSVQGDLLTDIYLETQRALELANQGGARAKVQSVDLQALQIRPGEAAGQFIADATWNVNGSVGHWGHVHSRVNQYQAELAIEAVDGRWTLSGMNILQETRL